MGQEDLVRLMEALHSNKLLPEEKSLINSLEEIHNLVGEKAVKKAIEIIAFGRHYRDSYISEIADLGDIAKFTKNSRAVEMAAEVIRYYGLSYELQTIAKYTKSGRAIKKAAEVILEKEEYGAPIASGLYSIAKYTKKGETVEKAAEVIKRYKGETASWIAKGLEKVAEDTKDVEGLEKAIEAYETEPVMRVVEKYDKDVASKLGLLAGYIKSKEVIEKAIEVAETYNTEIAKEIYNELKSIAIDASKTTVEKAIEAYKMDSVKKATEKYSGDDAKIIVDALGDIAAETKDLEAVEKVTEIIEKYDRDIAKDIAGGLSGVAIIFHSGKTIKDAAKVIEMYKGEFTKIIADGLRNITAITQSIIDFDRVLKLYGTERTKRLLEKYGKKDAEKITYGIAEVVRWQKEDDYTEHVERALEFYEMEFVKRVIKKYNEYDVFKLGYIAAETDTKIGKKTIELIEEYKKKNAKEGILDALLEIIKYFDKKAVKRALKAYEMEPVKRVINKYDSWITTSWITEILGYIAADPGNMKLVGKAAQIIERYNGEDAKEIAHKLKETYEELSDKYNTSSKLKKALNEVIKRVDICPFN